MGTLSRPAAAETLAALALAGVRGLGPRPISLLIERYGSAAAALAAARRGEAAAALKEIEAVRRAPPAAALRALRSLEPWPAERLRALERRGIGVVTLGSPGYPESLRQLHDPPPVLYLRGRISLLGARGVAIVGTRQATEYGRRMARSLACGLVERGWSVISGMARGIDGAAHRAALEAGGDTVGVLGCGLDYPYPAIHRVLRAKLETRGLLLSEFEPGLPPAPGLFPRRNRIIAALADAVVVVQAGRRSGALITVEHALDLGREIFAVPGPVGPPASRGVHRLLRDGAGLATCAEDVLRALGHDPSASPAVPAGSVAGSESAAGSGAASESSYADTPRDGATGPAGAAPGQASDRVARLLARLEKGVADVDALATASGLPIGESLAWLSRWELEGRVSRLPGGRFALARPAGALPGGWFEGEV